MRQLQTRADKLRLFNAVIASFIAVFFLVHSVLGTATFVIDDLTNDVPWLVWGMLGIMGVHVVASVCTTGMMLADTERPPSSRKKRHFLLKWATGVLLALVIVWHLLTAFSPEFLARTAIVTRAPFLLALAALAWHVGIATKSLARDLGISKRSRDIMRGVYVVALGLLIIILSFCANPHG